MEREDINPRSAKRVKPNEGQKNIDVLSSIQNQMIKEHKIVQHGKNALKKPDPNYLDIMVDNMLSIPLLENNVNEPDDEESTHNAKPKGTPDAHEKKIEFEIRVGGLVNNKFTPGIKESDFEAYYKQLDKDPDMVCDYTDQAQYYYEYPNGVNLRVVVDENTMTPLSAEMKHRLKVEDLELNILPYPIRFSISTESEHACPSEVAGDYKLRRKKSRWSFSKKGSETPGWRTDLTKIHTYNNEEKTSSINYEIEFEFDEEVIAMCKNNDRNGVRSVAAQFWDFTVQLMNMLYKGNTSHFDKSINLEKVTDEDEIRDLREQVHAWIYTENHHRSDFPDEFPGSMPVNFQRRNIQQIVRGNPAYFVSEKTDGIRAMLLILQHQGVYLIDRRYDFYLVPEFNCLLDIYATNGLTLLDGEIVNHYVTKKPVYLIFDLLALNGNQILNQPLMKRLRLVGTDIVTKYRESLDKGLIPQEHPFTLIGKQFMPLKNLASLAKCLSDKDGTRVYKDESHNGQPPKRYHKTDGLIFTPDLPYVPRTDRGLFKWKYTDEWSIDLKVLCSKSTGNISFSCVGDRGSELDWPLNMAQEDLIHLSRYMMAQRDPNAVVIVECVYDDKTRLWRFKMIRTDKNRANHVRVINNTIDVITENVSLKELQTFFSPSNKNQ